MDPNDINILADFLAFNQIPSTFPPSDAADVLVLCVSAILPVAEKVFAHLEKNPTAIKTLVLCGGIGHSTPHLYEAIANDPRYAHLLPEIDGLPEAQVLHHIFRQCFDAPRILSSCRVLIEDRSTNCGANAIETKRLLEVNGICPESMLIVQDPTMSRRTVASFEKAFSGQRTLRFTSWPTFVPKVRLEGGRLVYDESAGIEASRLWRLPRFLGLVMGEIPRLRDDEEGYGPKGKGFIVHVDVPDEVEEAWKRIKDAEMEWERRGVYIRPASLEDYPEADKNELPCRHVDKDLDIVTFHIHISVACKYSSFFYPAVIWSGVRSTGDVVNLPDYESDTFGLYLHRKRSQSTET
ncbi:hypothetical protein KXX29_005173 [Aspergillus fumigatus]|nr:hypothetical protein KXX29_005173 [Aspergillus fumigatus]